MRDIGDLVYTPYRLVHDSVKTLNNRARINFSEKLKKISSEETNMNKVSSTKPVEYTSVLTEDETYEKVAFSLPWIKNTPVPPPETAASVFGKGLAGAVALGVGGALVQGVGNMISNAMDRRKYERSLQIAVQIAPSLQRYPIEMLRSYLPMIVKASPTVASDPRLLANYMESMIDAEGHLNLATFRELSALEGNVLQNSNLANPYKTELIKEISKSVGQNIGGVLNSGFKAM